jgi:hypothetical protein
MTKRIAYENSYVLRFLGFQLHSTFVFFALRSFSKCSNLIYYHESNIQKTDRGNRLHGRGLFCKVNKNQVNPNWGIKNKHGKNHSQKCTLWYDTKHILD